MSTISKAKYQALYQLAKENGLGSEFSSLFGERKHIRDSFAKAVIQGMYAAGEMTSLDPESMRVVAEVAFDQADAMMEARKEKMDD
jgi:hypothetical protein